MSLNELIEKLETLRRENEAAGEMPVAITIADFYDGYTSNAENVKIGADWIKGEYVSAIVFE